MDDIAKRNSTDIDRTDTMADSPITGTSNVTGTPSQRRLDA